MSDDEAEEHDLIGDEEESERESVHGAAEEEADDDAGDAEEESASLFVFYNRQYYKFSGGKEDKPGFVRCYNRIVKVPNGKALGMMVAGPEGWPSGEELFKKVTADKIVVVSGKMKEDDTDLKNVWYLLVEVEGQSNKQDHLIARHIPKKVYMEIAEHIKSDPNMATSSLLTMLAHDNNTKAINPQINGFLKVIGDAAPKSGMITPEKKVSKEKGSSSTDKQPASKKQKTGPDAKKPAAPAPAPAAEESAPAAEGKEKKVSASSFFKPKPSAEKAAAATNPASPGGGMPTNEGKEDKKKDAEKAEKAPAPAPASNKRKADDAATTAGKATYKRTRTEQQETFEFLMCDSSQRTMWIPVPEGCTGGKIIASFQFQ
jgi:hypothetical protein